MSAARSASTAHGVRTRAHERRARGLLEYSVANVKDLPSDTSGEILRARLESLADPAGLLAQIFANAPMGLQIYARDGRCVLVNGAHTELFGGVPPPEYNIFEDTILAEQGLVAIVKRAFAGERISMPALWYDIRQLRNLPPTTDVSGGKRIAISAEFVPLRDASGEVSHVLLVFNNETAAHEARELAEAAAVAADQARIAAERRAAQSAFLAESGRILAGSLDFETTLAQIARLATPALADFCIVDLVETDGTIRRLAAVHADPAQQSVLDELRERFPPTPDSPQPAARVLRTGVPELLVDVDPVAIESHTFNPEHSALMMRLGVRSHLAVPLELADRAFGVLSFGYTGDRRYSAEDLPLFEALAGRAAVAIENARLYRAAQAARADAEAASRAKDEFLAMLGHELRNPLAPIVTALELTQHRPREYEIIQRQVGYLRRLVDDLLDVSRITRGTLELALAPVDIADAIADGIEAARPLVDQRGHELVVDIGRGLVVSGDRVRLAQVITNVLTNAARYTPRGGRIEVAAARHDGDVRIVVRDNGVGLPPDLVPHVFEIFARGMRPIDRSAGGLGLGLAIVKSLTELHGGRVVARSEGVDRGTEVTIILPAHSATQSTPKPTPPAAVAAPRAARVLVVDDNVDAANMLADGLAHFGFTPLVAHDGAAALALARGASPQLAIVDIGMPGMDGYELAVALHAIPDLAALPIVAVTGYGQPSDRVRTDRAGFAAHFVKPVQLDALIATLDRLLG